MLSPELPSGDYPFGLDVYPLAELVMHEHPAAIARLIISQADLNGQSIARDDVVELNLKGGEMEGHRYIVYWSADDVLHMLVPRRSVVGRA